MRRPDPGIPRLHSPLPSKRIDIVAGSMLQSLLGCERQRVNALHHQSIDVLGDELDVVAVDQYGIVQAIERRSLPLLLGVQWHPEFMPCSRHQQRLFDGIVRAAREWLGDGGGTCATRGERLP